MASKTDRIKTISALFRKANDPSCTEEEAATFMEAALNLQAKYELSDLDLEGVQEEKITYIQATLNVKYANGWRVNLCNAIAHNTGVLCTYVGRADKIFFTGREHTTLAAQIIAEGMVNVVETMSTAHAKRTGSGTKGRRQFADGCSLRLRIRIRDSINLSTDPRLPVLHMKAIEDAKGWLEARYERPIKSSKGNLGSHRSDRTQDYLAGYEAGEKINLRQPS
jgi:hypothetical protein